MAAALNAMGPEVMAQVSADWWAKFQQSAFEDPWVHGFNLLLNDGANVGIGSFKGPPVDGMVEIAYAIVPEHQRKGYATACARALVEFAWRATEVRKVIAHTLPDGVASQRVLLKSGFTHTGEVVDPEDGTGVEIRDREVVSLQRGRDAPGIPGCGFRRLLLGATRAVRERSLGCRRTDVGHPSPVFGHRLSRWRCCSPAC